MDDKAKGRDPTKFNEFYKENSRKVFLRCRRGGFSNEDAEDITQNIFYRLWHKYDDDYFTFNAGYFWKYLTNYEIINYVVAKEKYEMLRDNHPSKLSEDTSILYLIQFIKENLPRKERKFFNKLLTIGRTGMDKEHKRNSIWWDKYKKNLKDIMRNF